MQINKPIMMKEAEKAKNNINKFGFQIVWFLVVYSVITILESIPITILMFKEIFQSAEFSEEVYINIMDKYLLPTGNTALLMLFSTIFAIIVPIVYCKFIEKRSLFSMGIIKKHAIRNYLFGLIVGFIMFSAVVALNVFWGGMTFNGLNSNIIVSSLIIYFIAFGIQGMSEEVMCRGYLMNTIGSKHNVGLAIFVSSITFAILHLLNEGITILAFINLFLFGAFAALYMICFDNIWGVCAIHSIWNFAQGNIFGISVSGIYNDNNPIFLTNNVAGKDIINGGAFGVEGGIAVTIVLMLGILLVTGWMWYKKKIQFKNLEPKEKTN